MAARIAKRLAKPPYLRKVTVMSLFGQRLQFGPLDVIRKGLDSVAFRIEIGFGHQRAYDRHGLKDLRQPGGDSAAVVQPCLTIDASQIVGAIVIAMSWSLPRKRYRSSLMVYRNGDKVNGTGKTGSH